jgi:hypothetical protein
VGPTNFVLLFIYFYFLSTTGHSFDEQPSLCASTALEKNAREQKYDSFLKFW